MATLDLTEFAEPGLYLMLPDGERIVLTRTRIEACARAMLENPEKIPVHVRAAVDYQPCAICPARETAEICHAIMATLPFLDEIDRYMSYDEVQAVFLDSDGETLHTRRTSMQEALQYVSILSLTHYCEVGRQYAAFFDGVDPLMPQRRIADAVFLNMYFACNGDQVLLMDTMSKMQEDLLVTAECQVKRLQLICKRDAFLNAFVTMTTTAHFILMKLHDRARQIAVGASRPGAAQ